MMYKHDNELYVPCEVTEAKVLFSTNSKMVFVVNEISPAKANTNHATTLTCNPVGEDFSYTFREHELGTFGLVPCKPAECVFKFRLESLSFDDLTRLVANQKGLKWGDNHALWVATPTDHNDLGNIDFEFPDATFTARLDKPTG